MTSNGAETSDAVSKILDDLYRPQISLANAAEALGFLASAHLDDGESLDWDLNYSLFHYSEVMDRAAADLVEVRRNLAEGHDLVLLEDRGKGPGKVQVLPARQLSASKRDAWGKAVSTSREDRDPVLIEHHAEQALHYVSGDAIYAADTQIYRAQQALNRIADQATPPSASLIAALHALPRVLRPIRDDSTPVYSAGTFETMGTCVNTFMDLHTDHPESRWTAEDMQGPQREPIPPPAWQGSAARQASPTIRRSATSPPTPARRTRRVAGRNRPTTT